MPRRVGGGICMGGGFDRDLEPSSQLGTGCKSTSREGTVSTAYSNLKRSGKK